MKELKGKSGIYKITCLSNQKFYVGSSVDLHKRKLSHFRELRVNKHLNPQFQYVFNKYGEDNFIFEVLEEVPLISSIKMKNYPELIEKEQYWMDKLQPHFNTCKAAGSTLGRKRSKEEMKNTLDANRLDVYQIDCKTLEIIKEWPSTKEAGRELDFMQPVIWRLCAEKSDKCKTYKGFYWCYKKDYERRRNEFESINKRPTNEESRKLISQIDPLTNQIIKTFESIWSAANHIKEEYSLAAQVMTIRNNISFLCKNSNTRGSITRYGYKWSFVEN